jgi:hypothetical protein
MRIMMQWQPGSVPLSAISRFNSPLNGLTYSLPLISALWLDPIYVARIPAAPFVVADESTNHG